MENRYDKYKDSGIAWIGEIPEHWKKICLKHIGQINIGNQDTQDNVPDGKYTFFVRSQKVERSKNILFSIKQQKIEKLKDYKKSLIFQSAKEKGVKEPNKQNNHK